MFNLLFRSLMIMFAWFSILAQANTICKQNGKLNFFTSDYVVKSLELEYDEYGNLLPEIFGIESHCHYADVYKVKLAKGEELKILLLEESNGTYRVTVSFIEEGQAPTTVEVSDKDNTVIYKAKSSGEVNIFISSEKDFAYKMTASITAMPVKVSIEHHSLAVVAVIGDYPAKRIDLKGIDEDRKNIIDLLTSQLDWPRSAIVEIADHQLTKENLIGVITQILDSQKKLDKVVFYFSGHGTRLPRNVHRGLDNENKGANVEFDNLDDALVLYDDLLLDNEIAGINRILPANSITWIVDACHSGTSLRGIQSKSITFTQHPKLKQESKLVDSFDAVKNYFLSDEYPSITKNNINLLAASRESQNAFMNQNIGSFFTYEMMRFLRKSNRSKVINYIKDIDLAISQHTQERGFEQNIQINLSNSEQNFYDLLGFQPYSVKY